MSKRINTIEELSTIIENRKNQLADISPEYLSEAGKAAYDAYKCVSWYLSFYDNLEELVADESFMNLVNAPSKHPEYYRVIRTVNRALERALA